MSDTLPGVQITESLPSPSRPRQIPTPKPAPAKPVTDPLSGLPTAQRNAYTALQNLLGQYGLETLAPQLLGFVKQGYDGDSLNYLLTQTPEYKQRFAGNDARIKNGLAPLSAADYLAAERSYRDVLRSSGLPANFYDSPSDYQSLISADISPTELKDRADNAFRFSQNAVDPNVKNALQHYYGVTDGHLAAYFLDPKQGEALIDRQVRSAEIGGAAKSNGLNVDVQHAQAYADTGMTYAQAQQAAAQTGLIKDDALAAASRFHTNFTESDLTDAAFGGLASAQRAQRQVASSEAGLFAGNPTQVGQTAINPGGGY